MERDEEKRIIDRVLAGDAQAFEALVLENQTQVYNLALRMVNNEQDACDIAQDAFIRAYRSLGNFRGESKFSVWLYRLTSNICLDFLRAQRRSRTISLSYTPPDEEESTELNIPDERFAPHTQLEQKELRAELQQALGQLPPEQREILLLREISGLSYDEIARSLTLEPGTVKSRIFRARKKLCNILMKDRNFSSFPSSNRAKGV